MRLIAIVLTVLFTTPVLSETLPSLTVTGEGRAAAVPDMAVITLGVEKLADTPIEAVNRTSDAMAAILATLEVQGIAARDVQTSGLSLNENWETSPGTRRVTGYRAGNSLTIRLRDVEAVGGVLQAVLADGANTLSGLAFDVQDKAPLLEEARRAAVADAMAKARLYADAAGVALGDILSISESGSVAPVARSGRLAFAEAAVPVPVAAGETAVQASVTMVFALDQD